MTAYRIVVAPSAKQDVKDIYNFIREKTGEIAADKVLGETEELIANLAAMLNRGNVPQEHLLVGRRDYRELHFKPYRIFYRVAKPVVEVTAVLDGRRDMTTLLRLRLSR